MLRDNFLRSIVKVPAQKRYKTFMFLISYSLFLICLASCATHVHPGKKIFHYNESSGIASLDPAFAKNQSVMWAVHQLYNTLVEVDDNMKLVPSLAKSWEISSDNLV